MTLSAAITCADGRARRRGLAADFVAAFEAEPALIALRAALDAGEEALAAAQPVLAECGWLDRMMAWLVAACGQDPLFEPPLQPIGRAPREGLRLFVHPRLAISLLRLPAPEKVAGTIGFAGQRSLVRFLGDAPKLALWRLEDGRCLSGGARAMKPGELFAVDGAYEAWSMLPGSMPAVLLQATARSGAVPLSTYDVTNGALLGRTATDGAAMRMQLIASLLCRMAREDAAPVLREAALSGPAHLRWHIARELTAMSPDAAEALLMALAANDPDAEVRAAASATLRMIAA